jgi:DNA topoisomerase-1
MLPDFYPTESITALARVSRASQLDMAQPAPKPRRAPRPSKDPTSASPTIDPKIAARDAGLRYVTDAHPGFSRRRSGKGFRYLTPDGKTLRDPEALKRIRSLVIPPAWRDVWIAASANAHLQVTGRDARGRKQSRYHPRWREARDETKYERMLQFADALPGIRERVDNDLCLHGLPREKILATIVSLMETTLIRVGNEEYARENKSYGLTTMRTRHVEIEGSAITFSFQGKSKVHHTINLHDRRLAAIVKRCADLPGYELFQYVDADGERHNVDSADVNEYLRAITGEHYTAKDFRTWAGSVLACCKLQALAPFTTETEAKKNVVQAIAQVASRLGNTASVCRKCYVHPEVLQAYLEGRIAGLENKGHTSRRLQPLEDEERLLVALLLQRKQCSAA